MSRLSMQALSCSGFQAVQELLSETDTDEGPPCVLDLLIFSTTVSRVSGIPGLHHQVWPHSLLLGVTVSPG